MVNFHTNNHSVSRNNDNEYWFNPVDRMVYSTLSSPDNGFTSQIGAEVIYNPSIAAANRKIITQHQNDGSLTQNVIDGLPNAYRDSKLEDDMYQYDGYMAKGHVRQAALISTDNTAVDVVPIFEKLYGLLDRPYAGVELALRVPTEELIMNFDKVLKQNGLDKIPENTLPRNKDISYERIKIETEKYGLLARVSDEAIRKNVHNPFQDSITTASTKVPQRMAFNVISVADAGLTTIAGTAWDTFVAGTDRSTNDPTTDISRIVTTSIEGTNNGGQFNTVGINQIGGKIYDRNSFLRGTIAPVDTANLKPGTRPFKGFDGVTMVQDQFIPQGVAYLVDNSVEPCIISLEGPTQVATHIDPLTKTQTYATFLHHRAQVLNPLTGRKMTAVYTPLSPT